MTKKVYIWKGGDNLDKLAKANGYKSGAKVWSDLDNKAIAKARRTPDKLQPGDKISIENLNDKIKLLRGIISSLEKLKTSNENQIVHYEECIKHSNKVTDALLADFASNKKKLAKAENTAALVEMCSNMAKGLAKIGTSGAKVVDKVTSSLAEAQKQAMEGLVEIHEAPAEFIAQKLVQKLDKSQTQDVQELAKAYELLDRWTSWFSWGTAIARKINGATWSNTLLGSLDGDLSKEQSETEKEGADHVMLYKNLRQHAVDRLAIILAELKKSTESLKAART